MDCQAQESLKVPYCRIFKDVNANGIIAEEFKNGRATEYG